MTSITNAAGGDQENRLKTIQETMCKSAREAADVNSNGGDVAFPSEPIIIKSGSGVGGLYKTEDPGALVVVGCIDYTFADGEHGQSGFQKMLGRVVGKVIVGIPFTADQLDQDDTPVPQSLLDKGFPRDPAKYGRVPADNLYFENMESGNYAK